MDCSLPGSFFHGILQARILVATFPSSGNLPDPGMEPGSPELQADSLPSEPPGKPQGCQGRPPLSTCSLQCLLLQDTGEQQTRAQPVSLGPSSRTFWRLRALSERKWLSTGKGGNLLSRPFQVPAAHPAGLEPWDGGGHRWPELRICLGHLSSWRLIKLRKRQAGELGVGEAI